MRNITPFHIAIPVGCLIKARHFYGELLGCKEGRSSEKWVDYNFYGHQLVCHEVNNYNFQNDHNPVDGEQVPIPHFGVVLKMEQWLDLTEKLVGYGIKFLIEPTIRFAGEPGEQATMFFFDPSGNAIEFKAFKNIEKDLFQK